jgi:hypothetical protein
VRARGGRREGPVGALQRLALGARASLLSPPSSNLSLYFRRRPLQWSIVLETQGPLGTLWVGLGLCAFYLALIWLNTLLGVFLTPLFIIPGTWLLEWLQARRRRRQEIEH